MQLTALDLNLLLVFEALFEERSVTAAAARLGLGQPGMSAALGRLRKRIGDQLFIRVRGEMRPTPKATELAPGLLAALGQLRRTLEFRSRLRPGNGRAELRRRQHGLHNLGLDTFAGRLHPQVRAGS